MVLFGMITFFEKFFNVTSAEPESGPEKFA